MRGVWQLGQGGNVTLIPVLYVVRALVYYDCFPCSRPRRIMSTPKRSSHMKSSHAPSPLAEQHRQIPAHQPPRPASHNARGDTLVMYTLDELKTPFAKRLPGTEITLKDFKERVFARKGEYR